MDCFASLAMTAENSGNSPPAAARAKLFATPRVHPLTRRLKIAAPRIRLSNDNAKFYLQNIVTSGSKSCLMGLMGASYKFSK
jgi:hypothetical protein